MNRRIPTVSWLVCWPCREYFKSSKAYAEHICPYGDIERQRSPHRNPDEKYRELIEQKREEYFKKQNSIASDEDDMGSQESENDSLNLPSPDTVPEISSTPTCQNSNSTFENNTITSSSNNKDSSHNLRIKTETAEETVSEVNPLQGEKCPPEQVKLNPGPLRSRLERSIFGNIKLDTRQQRPPPAGKTPKKSALQPSQVLMNHKTGNEDRPFACDLCDKRFGLGHHLNRHRRIHTGEKPFGCDLCNKCYARKEDMKVHRYRVHQAGDVPFTCRDCGRKFSSKLQYELHRQDHTGKKPYECGECGKMFVKKYSFDKHQLIHPSGKISKTVRHSNKRVSHSNNKGEKKSASIVKNMRPEGDSKSQDLT